MRHQEILEFKISIPKEQEGTYFTFPVNLKENVESISVRYEYSRYRGDKTETSVGHFTPHEEVNIIDIGILAPDGRQVGASGSDKLEFTVSETFATPGYNAVKIVPGAWQIIVGAYKVEEQGLEVHYKVTINYKEMRLLKGDLHTHTVASDGVHTAEELAWKAKRNGLDFLAITDHNQMVSASALPKIPGVTLIQGFEWTHYLGHANFMGVDEPYDGSFATNTRDEALDRFESALERGALITINHPFEPRVEFKFDLNTFPFHCLEVWNGPMRESNLKAIGFWHQLLLAGKKIPICGGSDYHRDTPFIFLGGPTTCVYALSNGASDILDALKLGRAYIIFSPDGPELDFRSGKGVMMGGSVAFTDERLVEFELRKLIKGDVVRVVTNRAAIPVLQATENGDFEGTFTIDAPGFIRLEVLRAFLPGLPMLPALVSNPIYFDS